MAQPTLKLLNITNMTTKNKNSKGDFNATSNKTDVSGSSSDFERELYKLINAYVSAGLRKPDLVHKMEYVTQSCRVS